MDKKVIDLEVKNNKNCTHLRIEYYYDKGGTNYFCGTYERRGYWFSVSPITKNPKYQSVSYTAFTGKKIFCKGASRFSQKAFDNFVNDETNKPILDNLIKKVTNDNNINL